MASPGGKILWSEPSNYPVGVIALSGELENLPRVQREFRISLMLFKHWHHSEEVVSFWIGQSADARRPAGFEYSEYSLPHLRGHMLIDSDHTRDGVPQSCCTHNLGDPVFRQPGAVGASTRFVERDALNQWLLHPRLLEVRVSIPSRTPVPIPEIAAPKPPPAPVNR